MDQWVKLLAANPDGLSLIPRPTLWKQRTDSQKPLHDHVHMCTCRWGDRFELEVVIHVLKWSKWQQLCCLAEKIRMVQDEFPAEVLGWVKGERSKVSMPSGLKELFQEWPDHSR